MRAISARSLSSPTDPTVPESDSFSSGERLAGKDLALVVTPDSLRPKSVTANAPRLPAVRATFREVSYRAEAGNVT
jgi:hypothetical protein